MLVFGMVSDEPIVIDEISMIDTSFPKFKSVSSIGTKWIYLKQETWIAIDGTGSVKDLKKFE